MVTSSALRYHLRRYHPPELGADGYPRVWHRNTDEGWLGHHVRDPRDLEQPATGPLDAAIHEALDLGAAYVNFLSGVKHLVRALAGHACERCRHPFVVGQTEGEWSPCQDDCDHDGPVRVLTNASGRVREVDPPELESSAAARRVASLASADGSHPTVEAQWRVLTVHHLNGDKADLRWWNLAALCQRCHLQVQGRVVMERAFILEHSAWFKPHAAGWYAVKYLGQELDRREALDRLDELLGLERLA